MDSHMRILIALVLTAIFIAGCSDGCGRQQTDVDKPKQTAKPPSPSNDIFAFINYDSGSPNVRLRFPSEALEPYPLKEWKGDIQVVRTYGYIWGTAEVEKAEALQFVSEGQSGIKLANDYFPMRSGLSWTYRKRVLTRYSVLYNDEVRDITLIYYWRHYHLPPDQALRLGGERDVVMSVRGQTRVTVATHPQGVRAASYEIYAEESYTLGSPEVQGDKQLFPLSITMQPTDFPSRYGRYKEKLDGSLISAWYFREKTGKGDIVYEKTIHSENPPAGIGPGEPYKIELSSVRPLLFDAPKSLIWLYNSLTAQPALVRHGYIVQVAERPVITPAGQFDDCLRVIEYVLERDNRNPLSLPDQAPEALVDCGWYTVSWYARGIGLVAEIQFDSARVPTYWMELLRHTQVEPSERKQR